ncbi:hypothetical protein ACF0H5_017513 [Mactra antiquata]
MNLEPQTRELAMQKLSFPPIRSGLQVTMAPKEPPERSWSRYKKVLIDNPKDSNLLQRQKLWNFQKLNRGAFRSQIASLPDIPYRHTNPVEKVSVATQVDFTTRFSRSLRVIFPNLTNRRASFLTESSDQNVSDETAQDKSCSPMPEEETDMDEYSDDFEEDGIELDDTDLQLDTITRTQNAGTMTENLPKPKTRKRKLVREKNPYKDKNPILSSNTSLPSIFIHKKKSVKFDPDVVGEEPEDKAEDKPEVAQEPEAVKEIIPTLPLVDVKEPEVERESTSDEIPFPVENIGHSSHIALDSVSILDFISGSLTDRSRNSERIKSRDSSFMATKRRSKIYSDPEADRVWFEKLVGDKELIDSENYESFARTRPNTESQSPSNFENKIETNKVTPRKNFTPRINDEFPAYHQVVSKTASSKNSNPMNSPSVSINKGKSQKRPPVNIGKFY